MSAINFILILILGAVGGWAWRHLHAGILACWERTVDEGNHRARLREDCSADLHTLHDALVQAEARIAALGARLDKLEARPDPSAVQDGGHGFARVERRSEPSGIGGHGFP